MDLVNFSQNKSFLLSSNSVCYPNGDKYTGDFSHGLVRHGQGTMTYNNGAKYSGQWVDDFRDGTGTMEYTNGDTYSGHWEKGAAQGYGIEETELGDLYEGLWSEGKRSGEGKLTMPCYTVFEGVWVNDKLPKGKIIYNNGWIYSGDIDEQSEHGCGTMFYGPDDTYGYYRGEWSCGKRNGLGNRKYKDGSQYSGYWKEDQKHGKGIMTYGNGSTYDGEWKDGRAHGKGKIVYNDGSSYEGNWKEGKRGCGFVKLKTCVLTSLKERVFPVDGQSPLTVSTGFFTRVVGKIKELNKGEGYFRSPTPIRMSGIQIFPVNGSEGEGDLRSKSVSPFRASPPLIGCLGYRRLEIEDSGDEGDIS